MQIKMSMKQGWLVVFILLTLPSQAQNVQVERGYLQPYPKPGLLMKQDIVLTNNSDTNQNIELISTNRKFCGRQWRYSVPAHSQKTAVFYFNPGYSLDSHVAWLIVKREIAGVNLQIDSLAFNFPPSVTELPQDPFFTNTIADLGAVPEGPVYIQKFEFVNNGTDTLQISEINTSCGCLASHFNESPILPGARAEISLHYYSQGRPGPIQKSATVHFGGKLSPTVLYLMGYVQTEEEKNEYR